jgi:hypothetical protein
MRAVAFVCLAAVFLGGCVAPPQKRNAAFIESEYAPYDRAGTGAIEGQAFLKTRGGDVKTAAGNAIVIHPVTTYSTETYQRLCIGLEHLEAPDPRSSKYTRTTLGDVHGGFRFEGLPAGEYFVSSTITWEYQPGYSTGSVAHAKVTVREGQTTKVVVTRQPE